SNVFKIDGCVAPVPNCPLPTRAAILGDNKFVQSLRIDKKVSTVSLGGALVFRLNNAISLISQIEPDSIDGNGSDELSSRGNRAAQPRLMIELLSAINVDLLTFSIMLLWAVTKSSENCATN